MLALYVILDFFAIEFLIKNLVTIHHGEVGLVIISAEWLALRAALYFRFDYNRTSSPLV
jgi:hypothetical protein